MIFRGTPAGDTLDNRIGRKVYELRVGAALSLAEVASRLGVSVSKLEEWEAGERRVPSRKLLELSSLLNVRVSCFFEAEQDDPRQKQPQQQASIHANGTMIDSAEITPGKLPH